MVENPSDRKLFYVPNKWYSFTLNPSDEYQYFGKPDRLKRFKDLIYETILQSLNQVSYYRYNLELSEPRGNIQGMGPRLHIHGRFILKSNKCTRDFLLYGIYNLTRLGFLNIDTCDDTNEWDSYCIKQQTIMRTDTQTNHTKLEQPTPE